jgi:hypothetical protein
MENSKESEVAQGHSINWWDELKSITNALRAGGWIE